jgi:hypothetical protein
MIQRNSGELSLRRLLALKLGQRPNLNIIEFLGGYNEQILFFYPTCIINNV